MEKKQRIETRCEFRIHNNSIVHSPSTEDSDLGDLVMDEYTQNITYFEQMDYLGNLMCLAFKDDSKVEDMWSVLEDILNRVIATYLYVPCTRDVCGVKIPDDAPSFQPDTSRVERIYNNNSIIGVSLLICHTTELDSIKSDLTQNNLGLVDNNNECESEHVNNNNEWESDEFSVFTDDEDKL